MSTRRLLYGVTHVVITTAPSAAKAKATGVIASAELGFGPDVTNAICNIDYIQMSDKSMVWRLPHVTYVKDGKTVQRPVFQGLIAIEVSNWAALAVERVRKQMGTIKFSRIYTVPIGNASTVEETRTADSREKSEVEGS